MNREFGDLPATERFSSRAGHYAKYRPGYPPELLSLLARDAGFSAGSIVADVGSGTGILSRLLLENRNTVYAVEPNAQMRRAAERDLAAYGPAFRSIDGTAEATTLRDRSVHGVTVAQAFHWFDGPRAAAEFRRILKPGGFIA